eukprot:6197737-Pleurochrysis_carterae.AAC.2
MKQIAGTKHERRMHLLRFRVRCAHALGNLWRQLCRGPVPVRAASLRSRCWCRHLIFNHLLRLQAGISARFKAV